MNERVGANDLPEEGREQAKGRFRRMGRRELLLLLSRGLAYVLTTAAVTPLRMESVPRAEAQQALRERMVGPETNYEREVVFRLLSEGAPAKDWSDRDLDNAIKFAQHLFVGVLGRTVQEQMHITFDDPKTATSVIVSSDPRYVGTKKSGGRFVHSSDDRPHRAYIGSEARGGETIEGLLHELAHGAYGQGEMRAVFVSALCILYTYATNSINDFAELSKANDMLRLWDPREREKFLKADFTSFSDDLAYTTLPVFLFGTFRKMRKEGRFGAGKSYEPRDVLLNLDPGAEDALYHTFISELRAAPDTKSYLDTMFDDFLKECVFLMKRFNKDFTVPEQLVSYDDN